MKTLVVSIISMMTCVSLNAQVRYVLSTDTTTYQYGDSIHVSITAYDTGSVADTLNLSYCDVTVLFDGENVKAHSPCPLVIVSYIIQPGDSLNLGPIFLSPLAVADTISTGSHFLLGVVGKIIIPDTVQIYVVTHAEAMADNYFPLGNGDYWQYLVESVSSEPPFERDSSAYSMKVVGDTIMSNGYDYREILFKDLYPGSDSSYLFRRVVPTTGSVFQFDTSWPSDERPIDSLLAQVGDTSSSSPDIPGQVFPFGEYVSKCTGEMNDSIFGVNTSVKEFSGSAGILIGYSHALAQGFGVWQASYSYDFGVTNIDLAYARINGVSYGNMLTGVRSGSILPVSFELLQNYPNPFNPTTAIIYKLTAVSRVTLKVYDVLGRAVETLVDSRELPGRYTVRFDGSRLASGIYFCRLRAGNYVKTIKMALLK